MNTTGYEALRTHAAWIDLSRRGKILAAGEDNARLLHAMTTNHVQQLAEGEGLYAFFLNAQGRIIADVNLFRTGNIFLLDTEPGLGQKLCEHLDNFIIADDVTLEDQTEALATIGLEGPDAEEVLPDLGAPVPAGAHGIVAWGHGYVVRAATTGPIGFFLIVPADEKAALLDKLESTAVPEATAEAAEAVRLENHKPRYDADIDETLIPHETQQLQALHFSKGCYLGQEIVERVRSRGHLNKMLVPLVIETAEPVERDTRVMMAGKDVGRITSAAFSPADQKTNAFAVVRVEAATAGATLTVNDAPASPIAVPALASKC